MGYNNQTRRITVPPCAKKQVSGFTLVEIVVALSVLAIGMGGIAYLNKTALDTARITFEMQEASLLASTHLNYLELDPELKAGSYQGRYASSRPSYSYAWAMQVELLTLDALPAGLISLSDKVTAWQVSLTVRFDSGARSMDFYTVLFKPTSVPQTRHYRPLESRSSERLLSTYLSPLVGWSRTPSTIEGG